MSDSESVSDRPTRSTEAENDIDPPQLSEDTMKALLEFYKEQEERENKLQEISEGVIPESFDENWNMSQFWYTENTANALAKECIRESDSCNIACISCPTLFRTIENLNTNASKKLFEYDTRFSVYKDDFIFYDYKSPLAIPKDLRETFSVIVADPPYLSENCLTKVAITMKFLAKPDAKLILCTGGIQEDLAYRLLNLKRCTFPIEHSKRLSNPFVCYANYNLDDTCKPIK